MINPNLENQNYLSILMSSKKKMNIAKIGTNSYDLRSEIGRWSTPKTPWDDIIYQLCNTNKVDDEKHFILECSALIDIRSHFSNIYHNSNLLTY